MGKDLTLTVYYKEIMALVDDFDDTIKKWESHLGKKMTHFNAFLDQFPKGAQCTVNGVRYVLMDNYGEYVAALTINGLHVTSPQWILMYYLRNNIAIILLIYNLTPISNHGLRDLHERLNTPLRRNSAG